MGPPACVSPEFALGAKSYTAALRLVLSLPEAQPFQFYYSCKLIDHEVHKWRKCYEQ